MESLLIYILKSAGLISLFYLLYIVLLKNDTSFTANRKFLMGGILASIILPAIYFTKKVVINAPEIVYAEPSLNSSFVVSQENIPQELDWWSIAGTLYLIITGFFIIRFLFRIFQILKMIHFSKIQKEGKFKIIETQDSSGPFSFFNYLFINSEAVPEEEYLIMLQHEKVHANQFHSLDMLASHLFAAILWFNPISWFYKNAVEQNLEFIADHETAQVSECIQQYQHVLVKVSTNQYQNVLVNHFYQSFIKKRIVMLNKKSYNRNNISKMSLIFPLLLAFMLTFNVKTEAQVKRVSKVVVDNVQFYPDELASALITKNSTKAQLEEMVREFENHGVALQFKKLRFSKEGLLTRININYKIEKTGDSGNFNKKGDAPIDDIEISLSEDFKIEFRSPASTNDKNEFVIITDSDSTAIGSIARPKKRVWKTNLDDVTIERVMYTTPSNKNVNGTFSVGNKVHYYVTESDSTSGSARVINVNSKNGNRITWTGRDSTKHKYSVIVLDSVRNNVSKLGKKVRVISRERKGDPIFIVNGKVKNADFRSADIDPDSIQNIYVLKNASAIKKYGSKGKNGVVEINTKNNSLFRIKAITTDAELEDLKRTIAAKSEFQLELNSVERNDKGLISKINLKFSTKTGKMVSGNYSDVDGIADIYFGEKEDGGVIIYSN